MTNRWSSANALSAAFCPAASPSKVKMTSPRNSSSSISSRRRILMWSRRTPCRRWRPPCSTPGQVAGHHVGVALDDDGLPPARDLLLGQVEAVEHGRLLVDRGLGGVEVLRLDPVVVEEPAGAEADDVAGDVADRPEQPAPEPVDRPALALARQAAGDELLGGEARGRAGAAVSASQPRGAKPTPKCSAAAWSKPRSARNCRAGCGRRGSPAARRRTARRPVRLDQPGALARAAARASAPPSS